MEANSNQKSIDQSCRQASRAGGSLAQRQWFLQHDDNRKASFMPLILGRILVPSGQRMAVPNLQVSGLSIRALFRVHLRAYPRSDFGRRPDWKQKSFSGPKKSDLRHFLSLRSVCSLSKTSGLSRRRSPPSFRSETSEPKVNVLA